MERTLQEIKSSKPDELYMCRESRFSTGLVITYLLCVGLWHPKAKAAFALTTNDNCSAHNSADVWYATAAGVRHKIYLETSVDPNTLLENKNRLWALHRHRYQSSQIQKWHKRVLAKLSPPAPRQPPIYPRDAVTTSNNNSTAANINTSATHETHFPLVHGATRRVKIH